MSRIIKSLVKKTFLLGLLLAGCSTVPRSVPDEQQLFDLKKDLSLSAPVFPKHQQEKKSYKVAVLLPLSGEHTDLGHSLQQAIELSFFDHPKSPLELVFKDTQGKREGAAHAIQEAIKEKSSLILGPVFSFEVQAVAPYAQAYHLPILSFSNDQSVARPSIYTLGFSPTDQVRQLVLYAASQGLEKIAAVVPSNAYGNLISSELTRLSQDHKITLVLLQSYTYRNHQILQNFKALEEHSFDALLLPAGGEELKLLIETIEFLQLDPSKIRFLGTSLWDSAETFGLQSLMGGWFVSIDPLNYHHFENRFQEIYEETPKKLSSLAYDTVTLIMNLLSKDSQESPFNIFNISKMTSFIGLEGKFHLKPQGVTERLGVIMEIQPSGDCKILSQ